MTDHGVVAIRPDRLDAFGDALLRAADDVLRIRLDAYDAIESARRPVPVEVAELHGASARLRELGHDTRHRLDIIRRLPWDAWPMPTSVVLGRRVAGPYAASDVARRLLDGDESALDRLLALSHDPYEAAAALEVLGVDGFRTLYASVELEEDAIARITEVLLRASQTVDHPGGLSRAFVDALFPSATNADDIVEQRADTAAVGEMLTAAGAGQYLAAATSRAARAGVASVVMRAGRVIAIGGFVSSVLSGLAGDTEELAQGLATGALGVIGAFAEGPVGWVAGGLSLVLTLVFALGRQAGPPPARTYPTDRDNPGGSHYQYYVNGAGIPVAPDGS